MADEIDFENGRISNFQRHVTLTLNRTIWYTIVHHSLNSIYTPNLIRIGETFSGRKDVRTDGRTDIEAGFIRSTNKYSSTNIFIFFNRPIFS